MFRRKSILHLVLVVALTTVPLAAYPAGGGGGGGGNGGASDNGGSSATNPPAATETTKNCFGTRQWDPETRRYVRFTRAVNGVWDPGARRCIRPDKAGYLDSHLLEDAVRELAYAGRYAEAQEVLAQMDQSNDIVLTYWGFTHRKMGHVDQGNAYYQRAIALNEDNILARSYMGQGFVEEGDLVAARNQLREIRVRGGRGTWAEVSLRLAIESGRTYSY